MLYEMKLRYMFRGTELGILEKIDKKKYMYNSNVSNEQRLINTCVSFRVSNYSLLNSENKESSYLFGEFELLVDDFMKSDSIRESARIKNRDSKWEKLVKFSKLNYFTPGFYVQMVDEET